MAFPQRDTPRLRPTTRGQPRGSPWWHQWFSWLLQLMALGRVRGLSWGSQGSIGPSASPNWGHGTSPTLGYAMVGQRCWDVLQTLELGGGRQMSAACLCAGNCRTFERWHGGPSSPWHVASTRCRGLLKPWPPPSPHASPPACSQTCPNPRLSGILCPARVFRAQPRYLVPVSRGWCLSPGLGDCPQG